MFCINCGKEVSEGTAFCPYCGAKIENAQPTEEPKAEEVITPAATEQPVAEQPVAEQPVVEEKKEEPVSAQAPTTPVQEMSQAPVGQAAPVGGIPTATAPKNDKNKTLILIIILAVVVIVGIVVIGKTFIGSDETEPATPSTPTQNEPSEPTTVVDNTNTASYMGYTFTLPEGFTSKTDATYGLILSNKLVAYSILVDYTNSYEKYKAALINKYPTQASSLEKTVGGRKFLIGQVTDKEYKGSEYITTANDGETFVGLTLNVSNTVEYNDYQVLAEILDSSKKSGSNFAAGDSNDPGKNGTISLDINRQSFGFNE